MDIPQWAKAYVYDRAWRLNVLIGILLWIISYQTLTIVVSQTGYNSFLVNLALSLTLTAIWYPINRWLLWGERDCQTATSAKRSIAWWLVTFPLNQGIFALVVLVLDVPYTVAKPALIGLGLAEFCVNYWYKKYFAFAPASNPTIAMA
jgi:hypothetical protein